MRQVLDTIRKKKVYNISPEEFKKGDWLKLIPDSELIEVTYKNHFLTVHDARISKVTEEVNLVAHEARKSKQTEKVEEAKEDGRSKHKRS